MDTVQELANAVNLRSGPSVRYEPCIESGHVRYEECLVNRGKASKNPEPVIREDNDNAVGLPSDSGYGPSLWTGELGDPGGCRTDAPAEVCYSSLTAKNCCDAMLSFWQFTGIPSKISTVRATNFAGELTREFLKRIGCTPIFAAPSNSAERTIGNLKFMISKVAQKYPRS